MIGWSWVMVALRVFARGPGIFIFVEMVSEELKKTDWMDDSTFYVIWIAIEKVHNNKGTKSSDGEKAS